MVCAQVLYETRQVISDNLIDAMQGMSEDEPEGEEEPEVKIDEEKNEAARKAREDRQEKLRKMMEDDGKTPTRIMIYQTDYFPDEDMPDVDAAEDSQPIATPPVEETATPEPAEAEPTVTVEGGRRRGKRKVMKKKKVKDEDGYLGEYKRNPTPPHEANEMIVTREEAVWESFSEDEPEAKKLKPAVSKTVAPSKGKPAGKKGQGSIASFFKKA